MDEDQEDFKCDFEELRVNMMNIVSWLMGNGANVQFGSSTRNECLVTVIDSPKPGLFVPATRKMSLIDFLSMVANDVEIRTECHQTPDTHPQPVSPLATVPIQHIPYDQLPPHVQKFFDGIMNDNQKKKQYLLEQMMKQQAMMMQQQNVSKPGQMHDEMQLPDGMPPFSLPPHLMKPTIKIPKPSDN